MPVELIVNGFPVAKQTLVADGALRDLTFEVPVARSSWVALRILPSSHTNPIWVLVGGRPVRASRRSAEWCLKGVDQCWSQKEQFIAAAELDGPRPTTSTRGRRTGGSWPSATVTDRRRFLGRSGLAVGALVFPEWRRPPVSAAGMDVGASFGDAASKGPQLPLVQKLDPDLMITQVRRVVAAAASLGSPLDTEDTRTLEAAFTLAGTNRSAAATKAIQRVLDQSCLVGVHINPEMRVKVARGPARSGSGGGRLAAFLVKVHNEAGTTASLRASSAQAGSWLDLRMFDDAPLVPTLSGLELEYRIVRLWSYDAGRREASLAFDVGQGTQDLGFRNEVPILFDC